LERFNVLLDVRFIHTLPGAFNRHTRQVDPGFARQPAGGR
jgi:hypothetical protein